MKATGIVRRIDDLGRVVIPKEIRRTMRIREGDPLEIFTGTGGEVVFKKYSPVGELSDFAGIYAESLAKHCSVSVIVCDRDSCIAAAGVSKKEVIERRISPALEEIIESRQEAVFSADKKTEALEGLEYSLLFAAPIIAGGDLCGCVALIGDGQTSESDINLVRVAALFLGKQMEE
ncbi:MAG: stage V sporulation T C-terminal domain-containing protein [Acutalibacteraceae bacterium]|nr:stage V sporulation T C-terminal domain-containing protein [Acutalibacteraceae bacterium]